MTLFALVVLGGAVGTAARYLLGVSLQTALGPGFPYGTLAVNLIGSFLVSVIVSLAAGKGFIGTDLRVVLTTGVMGGFTTYSSFNVDTLRYWQAGALGLGFLNLGATLLGCLCAGALGLLAGKVLGGG